MPSPVSAPARIVRVAISSRKKENKTRLARASAMPINQSRKTETRSSSTSSRGGKDSAYHGLLILGVGGKVHLECREERCDIDCGRLRLRLTALPARDDQQYAACFPTSLASHPFSAIDALLMSDHFVMAQNYVCHHRATMRFSSSVIRRPPRPSVRWSSLKGRRTR